MATNASDYKLNYVEHGRGKSVLMVHGFGASVCTWNNIREDLSRSHRLLMVDLVGFGDSLPPNDFNFTVDEQAHYLAEFIQSLEQTPDIVIAHSYGAGVILAGLVSGKFDFKKMVLIDPLAYKQKFPDFIKLQSNKFLSDFINNFTSKKFQLNFVLSKVYRDRKKISKSIHDCYLKNMKKKNTKQTLHLTAKNLMSLDESIYSNFYSNIEAEILILHGDRDRIIPLANSKKLSAATKNSQLKIIENCGHAPHEECPNATNHKILEFLE